MVTEMESTYELKSMDPIFSLKLFQLVSQPNVDPIQKQILILSP